MEITKPDYAEKKKKHKKYIGRKEGWEKGNRTKLCTANAQSWRHLHPTAYVSLPLDSHVLCNVSMHK
jgi:hypothetical protein